MKEDSERIKRSFLCNFPLHIESNDISEWIVKGVLEISKARSKMVPSIEGAIYNTNTAYIFGDSITLVGGFHVTLVSLKYFLLKVESKLSNSPN